MSKIAKMPIKITDQVTYVLQGNKAVVTGPKGTLNFDIPVGIKAQVEDGYIVVSQVKKNDKGTRALFGLTRSILANLVQGVTEGFEKKLELTGVGYRATGSGSNLNLSLGFSHPVIINANNGIQFKVEENIITVSGIDKVLVGDMAAKIRSFRPPEPYKGKGIKYVGEKIRRKAGKAAKAVGGAGGK